ncbi:hypothetical protein ANN_11452 [Periplaneta americana]|uniref:Uncharacterized protein n=1 Tax=Periplaneta americana TaxID=6978 RepID=A0ABQ8T521_PERAM|nr:hypothetical protein ANN_11452 [Periplaneta americana]
MSPGSSTESYPAFARIGLRENPEKTSTSLSARKCSTFSTCRKFKGGDKVWTPTDRKTHYLQPPVPRSCCQETVRRASCTPQDFPHPRMRYVKDSAFVPPLLINLLDLRARIIAAIITAIDWDVLYNVRDEADYRLYVCRITKVADIEN